jgi:hypothetical protein
MVLVVGLVHLWIPGYGMLFMEVLASIYPGFHGGVRIGDLLIGTLYALVDGAIGGALFAWLYNRMLRWKGGAAR